MKKFSMDDCDSAVSNMRLIMDKDEALSILKEYGDRVVALDFETTGLDPNYSHVRLSCMYHHDFGVVIFDHMFCGSFKELSEHMLGTIWAVYNAKFEVRWFDKYHQDKVDLIDVDFMAKAVRGGSHSSLAMIAKRDLGVTMDKQEQLSDWSRDHLSTSQLNYAGMDAVITYGLYEHWIDAGTPAKLEAAFIMQDAVRATVECEQTGLVLDVDVHKKNIATWKRKQAIALATVRRFTPVSKIINLNSGKQVSDFLMTQLDKDATRAWPTTPSGKQLALGKEIIGPIAAKAEYPFSRWLNAFKLYKYYAKYLSTYGETLLTKQYLDDKITFRLNIGQAATCRYSSSSINIQNIPRAPWVRKAFLKPDAYDELVIADYSGVELRVLAELSGDKRLLQDAIYGNVHAASASAIYSIDEDEMLDVLADSTAHNYARYKEYRSIAKGFTFQNVYGAGAPALSIVLKCSVSEAEDAIEKWAGRYPEAYNYRYVMFDELNRTGYIPVCDGRTIFVYKNDRTIPVAANYGIQGAAASVMLRAMHHVYEIRNMESKRSLIGLCATVHDEMILGAKKDHVKHARKILKIGMERAWLDIFPNTSIDNLIDVNNGVNWGEAK